MIFDTWFGLLRVLVVGTAAYAALVLLLRASGKRTLAKLNAFDLVVTVALGSTLATVLLSKDVALAEGLLAARDVVVREKARDRARRCLVVVLTDGRATGGPDPLGRTRQAAARLVAEGAAAVVVDCETSFVRLGLAEELAVALRAPAVRLAHLRADDLTRLVTQTDRTAA